MLRSIKDLLNEFVKQHHLDEEVERKELEGVWKREMGMAISQNTKIVYFEKGVITVKTKTPVWRNELSLQKVEIIKKVNIKLNDNKVKDIRFI